jgi:hypothetical protein
MLDTHLKQTINDWLSHTDSIDQDGSTDTCQRSSTSIAANRKRKLIETKFDQTDCRNNSTRRLLLNISDDGSTSNTSQFSRSLMNRPILVPTSPSSKRSTGRRSPSPTRKLLALLIPLEVIGCHYSAMEEAVVLQVSMVHIVRESQK